MFDRSGSPSGKAAQIRSVKEWTRQALSVPEETVIMATELRCREPGCPPLETVIAVMGEADSGRRQFKIHKALEAITYEDVESGVTAMLRGEPHQHHDPPAAR